VNPRSGKSDRNSMISTLLDAASPGLAKGLSW
jgi:hypothetical protein